MPYACLGTAEVQLGWYHVPCIMFVVLMGFCVLLLFWRPRSPGAQHASNLVRLKTMQMLLLILVRLEEATAALSSVSALLSSGTAHGTGNETAVAAGITSSLWRDCAAVLKRSVRARIPDFQVLVAARQHAASRAAPGSAGSSSGGDGNDARAQAELLLPRILQVLARYVGLFPESLAESRLDLPRLLADPAALSSPPALLQTLGLLRAAPPRSGGWLAAAKGVSTDAISALQNHPSDPKKAKTDKGGGGVGGGGKGEATPSYLGVLLALVARSREPGSRMGQLRYEAEALATSVLQDCGLVGDADAGAEEEARIWLLHVRSRPERAACLERLCVEAGLTRLHSLSLTALSILEQDAPDAQASPRSAGPGLAATERGGGDDDGDHKHVAVAGVGGGAEGGSAWSGGRGMLAMVACPPKLAKQMQLWGRAVGAVGQAAAAGGVSPLLVCALEKFAKSAGKGKTSAQGSAGAEVEEAYVSEVIATLFHWSARPMAVVRALHMLGGAQDAAGEGGVSVVSRALQPLAAYCSRMVASVDAQVDARACRGLVAEEELLASGLFGQGGEGELRELSWRVWGAGGAGMLLALVVRAAGEGGNGEAVRVLEKMVRVMPWPVLLSQAFAGGATTLTDGRVLASLHRGLHAAEVHTPQLRAYARQLLLHLTSLLVSYEAMDKAGDEARRSAAASSCHELLQLLLAVLDCLWARVAAATDAKGAKASIVLQGAASGAGRNAGEECKALVETSEQLLAHTALRTVFVGACSAVAEGSSSGHDGTSGPVSMLALTVTHAISRSIAFLLSRPWHACGARSRRTQGPERALGDAARPYYDALVDAASSHIADLKRAQQQLGQGAEAGGDEEDRGGRKKSRKSQNGQTVQRDIVGAGARLVGRSDVNGAHLTLSALRMLHAHLADDKARGLVLAILGLDLHCEHTQREVDGYCVLAAEMIRSLSRRGASFTCRRTLKRLLATCAHVQTLPARHKLSSSLDSLAHTLIRSCVDASVYIPSAAGGRGAPGSLVGGESGVNEDDVAMIAMDGQAALMESLFSRLVWVCMCALMCVCVCVCVCVCARARLCVCMPTLQVSELVLFARTLLCSKTHERRQLCGFLARAVPSLRGDVLSALDDTATKHGAGGATGSARKKRARAEQASDPDADDAGTGVNEQQLDGNARMCSLLPLVLQVAACLSPLLCVSYAALGCRVLRALRRAAPGRLSLSASLHAAYALA